MTNEDFVRKVGIIYNQIMNLRKDEDYVINPPQVEKLLKVFDFFQKAADRLGGEVELRDLVPREQRGDIIATFVVFDIYGEDVQKFCDVMKDCSVIGIDATNSGVCIDCTIPDVFVPIDRTKN